MRNLGRKCLDVRYSHHRITYCRYAYKHRRDNIQYLRDREEPLLGVVVIDPEGNQLSEVTIENGDVVNACFVFEDISFRLQLIFTGGII